MWFVIALLPSFGCASSFTWPAGFELGPTIIGVFIASSAQHSGGQPGREAAGRHATGDVEPHRGQAHWTHRALPSRRSGLAHGAHLAAGATAAVEDASPVGLEPAHDGAGGHLEALDDLAGLRIDAAQVALVVLHGGVPELPVHPGDAGDESVRFDRAQDRAGLDVDLVDLPGAVLADPECSLGPGQARVAAVGRRWDGGDHLARVRIHLLNPTVRDLPEVLAVEGGAGLRGDGDFADQPAPVGFERDDALAAGEPDLGAIEGHAVDLVDAGIRAVLAEDLCLPGLACRCHDPRLRDRQRPRE